MWRWDYGSRADPMEEVVAHCVPQERSRIERPDSNSDRLRTDVERLFRESREPVLRYLRTLGSPLSLAEEITQEAFFRLHRAVLDGLQLNDARAWVFRVARNLYIDSRREHQRYQSTDQEEGEPDRAHTDRSPDPEQQMLERERIRLIQREFSRLPALLRECMYLRAQGLRYHEIALALDISITAAVDRVRRAVKKLGRRYSDLQ